MTFFRDHMMRKMIWNFKMQSMNDRKKQEGIW